MDNQNTTERKEGFLQNDKLLVCSMLIFYGLCIIGFIAGTYFWLGDRAETIKANATATGAVIATQQANATATVVTHLTEQAQYEFVDPFNENTGWLVSPFRNDYFVGSSTISGGIYNWKLSQVDKSFVYWVDSNRGIRVKDFDMYVDTRIIDGEPGDACSGFTFRNPNYSSGSYVFSVCNNSYYDVYYHKMGEWESLSGRKYSGAITNDDWNRLEVSARGNHFTFTINNVVVFEMTDDRQPYGRLALYIEVKEKDPVSIWFDNFGLQRY